MSPSPSAIETRRSFTEGQMKRQRRVAGPGHGQFCTEAITAYR
jgi:hypothetical protein